MLGRSPETEVTRLLYASAQEAEGFGPFLAALAALTHARGATLRIEAAGTQRFETGLAADLPPPDVLRRMRRERVYAQDELGHPVPIRLLRAGARAEAQAWLALGHPLRAFRAADGAQLDRLAPHLGPAVESWLALGQERARARQSAATGAALGAGWLWFDASGRLVETDAAARALLGPQAAAGRLELDDPLVARALRGALDRAVTGAGPPEVLTLRRQPRLQLALLPGLASPAPGLEPMLRGLLRAEPLAAQLDAAALSASLDLSRSETRLAVLLCDGHSLAEAATRLGWTPETARSCSKRIFARTGTRGQSDLIRRLLTGADWLAQV